MQRLTTGDTQDPGDRIEDVAHDVLEVDAKRQLEQVVDQGDQGDEPHQHGRHYHGHGETGHDVLPQHLEEVLFLRSVVLVTLGQRLGVGHCIVRLVRVDQGQHDKGAEHVEHQRGHHVTGLDQLHVGTDDGHGDGGHGRRRQGVHLLLVQVRQGVLERDEVLGLADDHGADGVERLQLAHAVDLRQHGADATNDDGQQTNVLQDADQHRDEDDGHQHHQEEGEGPFVDQATEHEVGTLFGKLHQLGEAGGEATHHSQTHFGVQHEPGQRQFDHQQLADIAQFNLFPVVAVCQQRQREDHHESKHKVNVFHTSSTQ
ncbi:hypothetical protein D3C79_720010 [compost metagenome]